MEQDGENQRAPDPIAIDGRNRGMAFDQILGCRDEMGFGLDMRLDTAESIGAGHFRRRNFVRLDGPTPRHVNVHI